MILELLSFIFLSPSRRSDTDLDIGGPGLVHLPILEAKFHSLQGVHALDKSDILLKVKKKVVEGKCIRMETNHHMIGKLSLEGVSNF